MKSCLNPMRCFAVAGAMSLLLAACGKSVEGSTYEAAGGAMTIQFQSGGKAVTSIGPLATECTYTEQDKSITLTCEGQPVVLNVNDDGSLSGPPGGVMVRLTKKQP